MILFPFSLGNKASQWEKNIPSELVSTWDLCKKEFLNKFFPKQKTARLRNDITSFKQGYQESLYEAWDRLKGYTRSCPHHGISKENLLGIFYRGTLEKYRRALDTASNGSFDNLNVNQGEQLIENLAQSDACYGGDFDRDSRISSTEDQMFKELNDKLDRMSKAFLISQKPVNFVGQFDGFQQGYQQRYQEIEAYAEGDEEVQEEVNYLANQGGFQGKGFNQNYRNHPNLSYRSNNVENPQDQVYPPQQVQAQGYQPKQFVNPHQVQQIPMPQGNQGYQPRPNFAPGFKQPYQPQNNNYQAQPAVSNTASPDLDMKNMFQQILAGQVKGQQETSRQIAEIHNKIDGGYNDLQAKFNNLQSHVKNLDNQVAQVVSSAKRPSGSLPASSEPKPNGFCNTILPSNSNMAESEHKREVEKLTKLPYNGSGEDMMIISNDKFEKKTTVDKVVVPILEETETPRAAYEPPIPFPGRILTKAKKKVFSSFKASM